MSATRQRKLVRKISRRGWADLNRRVGFGSTAARKEGERGRQEEEGEGTRSTFRLEMTNSPLPPLPVLLLFYVLPSPQRFSSSRQRERQRDHERRKSFQSSEFLSLLEALEHLDMRLICPDDLMDLEEVRMGGEMVHDDVGAGSVGREGRHG